MRKCRPNQCLSNDTKHDPPFFSLDSTFKGSQVRYNLTRFFVERKLLAYFSFVLHFKEIWIRFYIFGHLCYFLKHPCTYVSQFMFSMFGFFVLLLQSFALLLSVFSFLFLFFTRDLSLIDMKFNFVFIKKRERGRRRRKERMAFWV